MDTNFSDFQTYATYRSLSSGTGNKKSRNNRQSISSSSQRNSRNDSKSGKGNQIRKSRGGSSQTVKRQLEFQDDDDESNVPMLFRSYITPLSECNLRVVYDDDEEDSVPRILSNPRKVSEKSTTKATTSKPSSKSSTKSSSNHRFKMQKLTLLSASPPSTPLTSRSAPRVTFADDNDVDDESRKALEELIPSTPEFIPESELDVVVVPESPKPSTSNHDHHESPRIVLEKVATEPHRIAAESTTQSNYRIDTSESEEYSVDADYDNDADDDRRRRDYRNVDYANSPNAGYYVRKLLCVEESSDSGLDAVDRVDPFPMRRQEPKVVNKKSKVKKSRRERNNQRPEPQPPPNEPTTSKPSGSRVQTSISPPEPEHSGDSDHYVVDDQYTQLLQNQQQNPPPPPCPLSKSVINRRQVDRILTKLSRYAQLFGPRVSDNEEDDPTPEAIRLTLHLVEHMKKMNILFLNKDCQWLRDTSTGMMFERYLRLQVDARFVDLNSKTKLQLVCTVLPGSNYGPNGPFEFDGPAMQNRVKKSPEVCVHPSCPYRNTKLSKSPLKSSTSEPTESVPDEVPESDDVSYAKKNDILPVGYSVLLMYNKGFSIPKESFIGGSTKVRIFPDWKLQHLRKGVRLCCQKYYYVMLNACNLLIE